MRLKRTIQLLLLAALIAAAALWRVPAQLHGAEPAGDAVLVVSTLELVEDHYIKQVDERMLMVWAAEAIAQGVQFLNEPPIDEEQPIDPEAATEPLPEAEPQDAQSDPAQPEEPKIASTTVGPGDPPDAVTLEVRGETKQLDFSGGREERIEQLLAGCSFAAQHGGEIDQRELLYYALSGMLARLDPHSDFIDPEEARRFEEETSGSFGGIGIEIGMRDRRLTVIAPIEGTPAHRAGLLAGDLIVAIDGRSAVNITLFGAVEKIRGPQGTPVVLSIEREGLEQPFDVSIVRGTIEVEAVRFQALEHGVGYVRVRQFNRKTAGDLRRALQQLQDGPQGLRGLVLDLRNNPGGLLTAAVDVTDDFIQSGVIVSTRGRAPNSSSVIKAGRRGTLNDVPLIVLTNFGSASASEIVAGAIQDQGRGLIIGGTTFGKGSVQSIISVDDQSHVALTTSMYYTPSGRSIQASGIVPDIQLYYTTDEGELDRPFGEENLEGFLPNSSPEQSRAGLRVDAEKLYWFYRNAGRVPEELEAEDPDALMLLAQDLLSSLPPPTNETMLSAARRLLEPVNDVVVPEEQPNDGSEDPQP
ncbi:MAG: S41 family peptidase [Candidatus Alcyoniella australis]|nr:S41 family peptidase [Candidatus Alcyoniella australis]